LVGIGLVRPLTVRPVSGVWSRVDSRPVPPSRRFGAAFLALLRALFGAGRATFRAGFLAAA
jgi:hypothetical protein